MVSFPFFVMGEPRESKDTLLGIYVGFPDLANKNTGCRVKFGFQINDEYLFSMCVFRAIFITHLLQIIIIITYLKFAFN